MSDVPAPAPAPAPAPKAPAQPSRLKILSKAQNDVGGISLPKFTSDTGAVVGLITLNMVWSVFREFTTNPTQSKFDHNFIRIIAGSWIVGLGLLIVHEFDPHVAMLLAVLVVVGNVLSDNAGNKEVINAFSALFAGTGGS